MKAYLPALLMLQCVSPVRAIPPPYLPPVPQENQTAADALAAKMPVEEVLSAGNNLLSDGITTRMVADGLIGDLQRIRRSRCNRSDLREYLRFHVAPLLPTVLPEVARGVRANIAFEMAHRMSLSDLIGAREILNSGPGRALLLHSWGSELPRSESVAAQFTSALYGHRERLLQAALSECRTRGPPPPPLR